jgi:putative IMPACT (imprinted ancient) family translation regulator
MSTDLKGTDSINGRVMLTRYFGGTERGACVQVTPPGGSMTPYLSLTKEQALELAVALVEFANGKREEDD